MTRSEVRVPHRPPIPINSVLRNRRFKSGSFPKDLPMIVQTPEQHALSENITIDPTRLGNVAQWAAENVLQKVVEHGGVATNHDELESRRKSSLRKTPLLYIAGTRKLESDSNSAIGLLLGKILQPPAEVQQTVLEIYEALREPAERYFGVPLGLLQGDTHAAVAHVYFPGDPSGESHHDAAPTVPLCLECPEGYGALWVGKRPNLRGIDNIRNIQNSWCLTPEAPSYILFRGDILPHVAEGLPEGTQGARIGINYSYRTLVMTKSPDQYTGHSRQHLLDPTLYD
jgi:hypothetical protein